MRVDREEIEAFIEQSERPTVAKILGRFMLDPSEHHGRIEKILRETTGSAVSADSTEQVKITDGGVSITPVHLWYLCSTAKVPSPGKGYIAYVPPSGGRGFWSHYSRDPPREVCQ